MESGTQKLHLYTFSYNELLMSQEIPGKYQTIYCIIPKNDKNIYVYFFHSLTFINILQIKRKCGLNRPIFKLLQLVFHTLHVNTDLSLMKYSLVNCLCFLTFKLDYCLNFMVMNNMNKTWVYCRFMVIVNKILHWTVTAYVVWY